MKDYSKHIAVIGAGIFGLTLGVILKSHNIPCIIFEKYNSVSEYGAGISISPNGAEVLKSLNIYDDLLKISAKPNIANFYSNLKKIVEISYLLVYPKQKLISFTTHLSCFLFKIACFFLKAFFLSVTPTQVYIGFLCF